MEQKNYKYTICLSIISSGLIETLRQKLWFSCKPMNAPEKRNTHESNYNLTVIAARATTDVRVRGRARHSSRAPRNRSKVDF